MSKIKATEKKVSLKKEIKKKIALQLTSSLEELKLLLGDKKFNARIQKASRILSAGIKAKNRGKSEGNKVNDNVRAVENSVTMAT